MSNQFNGLPQTSSENKKGLIDQQALDTFKNYLIKIIYLQDKSQSQVTREIGVERALMQKWVAGKSLPDENLLPKISSVCNVPVEELREKIEISREEREKEKSAKKSAKKNSYIKSPPLDFPTNRGGRTGY